MKKKLSRIILSLALGSFLLLSYQNCGGDFGEFGSLQKHTYRSEFPFPVKAEADYFGFMSCSGLNEPSPDPDFFTFRLSSDSNTSTGGIGLADDFIETVLAEKVKRPAIFNLKEEVLLGLQESVKLKDTSIQMSILERNRLNAGAKSDRILYSQVFDSIDLDSPSMIEQLSYRTDGQTVLGKDFKMNIDWRRYRMDAFADLMQQMSSTFILGLNYSSDEGNYGQYLRSPQDYGEEYGGLYGRLFDMRFAQNKISNFIEKDAKVGANGHQVIYEKAWNCSSFTIVRPTQQDAIDSGCLNPNESFAPLTQNYNPSDAKQRALLGLLGDAWLVNSAKTCVIHKSYNTASVKKACYGTELANARVNYGAYDINLTGNSGIINANQLSVCWVE